VTDIYDRAQELDEQLRAAAIASAVCGHRIAAQMSGFADCMDCGDQISADRLKALPSARRCVTCQARVEDQKERL
jgi:DnaK suppressor protein